MLVPWDQGLHMARRGVIIKLVEETYIGLGLYRWIPHLGYW